MDTSHAAAHGLTFFLLGQAGQVTMPSLGCLGMPKRDDKGVVDSKFHSSCLFGLVAYGAGVHGVIVMMEAEGGRGL